MGRGGRAPFPGFCIINAKKPTLHTLTFKCQQVCCLTFMIHLTPSQLSPEAMTTLGNYILILENPRGVGLLCLLLKCHHLWDKKLHLSVYGSGEKARMCLIPLGNTCTVKGGSHPHAERVDLPRASQTSSSDPLHEFK